MIHLTFDLETLGNGPTAPIIQIGAAKFTDKILATYKVNIDWESLKKYKFDLDYSTIRWWMSQEDQARTSVLNSDNAIPLDKALKDFKAWILDPVEINGELKRFTLENYNYWTHATFDAPIITYSFKQVGLQPLPYRRQRDIRTLNMLAGKVDVSRPGVAHDAEDDAVFQALYIIEMLNKLK